MNKRIRNHIYPLLAERKFSSDRELYLFLVLNLVLAFVAFIHVFLLGFSLMTGVFPFVYLNVFSLLTYAACVPLIIRKRYAVVGTAISLEITLYAIASMYLVGFENYFIFYFFLVLMLQLIAPYGSTRLRGGVIVVQLVSILFVVLVGDSYVAPLSLGATAHVWSIVNVLIAFFSMLIDMLIGNILKNVIEDYNETRMAEFEKQAYADPLTGLYNRRYASVLFEKMKKKPSRTQCWAAMLDIDDFKKINDMKGHAIGDRVLVELADQLQASLRKSDKVFRWGGEEFLVLLENMDYWSVCNTLEKIRQNLEALEIRVMSQNEPIHFTVTIGATKLDTRSIEASIDLCDQKMYEGKRDGKNVVVI